MDGRHRTSVVVHAAVPRSRGNSELRPKLWQVIAAVCAVAMLLCNAHRSAFSVLLPLMASDLGLGLWEVGLLQSAMLLGYLAGQLPAGRMADVLGGERVLLWGLLLWSLPLGATTLAALGPHPVPALAASRIAFGLFSAVIMPSVSAMTAAWVPAQHRASIMASIYAFFNIGGVLGLIVAPAAATQHGWEAAFVLAAAGGVMWAGLGTVSASKAMAESDEEDGAEGMGVAAVARRRGPAQQAGAGAWNLESGTVAQVATLCWAHAVIGWFTFTLSSWMPLIIQSLGISDLGTTGVLASLPWLAAAMVGAVAGSWSDQLVRSGKNKLWVRRVMHGVSTIGCAVSVLPLALSAAGPGAAAGTLPPLAAVACLVAGLGCYAFSFGGFHAYVQDVAHGDAGLMLGLTNSCSIAMGIAGNLATGLMVQATGSYQALFAITALLQLSSWLAFNGVLHGRPLRLRLAAAKQE